MLDAWTPATKIVFLCSPNNPTGNLLDATAVLRVIEGLAGRALGLGPLELIDLGLQLAATLANEDAQHGDGIVELA